MRRTAFDDDALAQPTLRMVSQPCASVLVLSPDPTLCTELRALVQPRTGVVPIDGPAELLRSLRLLRGQRRALVVDARSVSLLAAVRDEPALLDDALVALWLASREQEKALAAVWPRASFVRCGASAGVAEIATLLYLAR